MEKRFDVAALGELLIDFTESGLSPQGNPLLEANPGGAPCNVLAMLKKLGKSCAFIGKVGEDRFGYELKDVVSEAGICTDGLLFDKNARTTLAFVKTAPNGDRSFSFYRNPGADMMLTEEELPMDIIRNCRIFHFGTLSMTHPGVREATKKAVSAAKEAGALISFDPNLRPMLWDDAEVMKEQVLYGLSVCDILKIADNEIEFLTGSQENEGIEQLKKLAPHCKIMNVTYGAKGSLNAGPEGTVFVPAVSLGGTIETTGAGDTFCACIINYVLEHGTELTWDQRTKMLKYANAAAYIVTTKKGAIRSMPDPAEVEAILL